MTEHESMLFGAIIHDNKILNYDDFQILTSDDFTSQTSKNIWDTINTLNQEDVHIDQLSIKSSAKDRKVNIPITAIMALQAITSANYEYYIKEVKKTALRAFYVDLRAFINDTKDGDPLDNIESLKQRLDDRISFNVKSIKKISDTIINTMTIIEERNQSHNDLVGIDTGYDNMNVSTLGFQKGHYYIVGARPSLGKTALAINLLLNVVKKKVPALFFSLEMSQDSINSRIIATDSNIHYTRVQNGMLESSHFGRLATSVDRICDYPLYMDCNGGLTIQSIINKTRQAIDNYGVEIVFIDYLGLMHYDSHTMAKHERYSEISRLIKQATLKLNIPIVLLSQVTRGTEGGMPKLNDLAETRSLEHDADVVMFLHRERDQEETVIRVAKNRNGVTGDLNFRFDVKSQRFYEQKRY